MPRPKPTQQELEALAARRPTSPRVNSESYTYDAIGDLITKLDRNGNAITYCGACPERSRRNALNRLTHKGYPDSTGVDYVYDLVGKIKSVTDPTGTYGFAYDNMGRLIGTTTQYTFLPGNTYSNTYTYDAMSNRTGFTASDGSTNTYAYDNMNRLTSLTNSVTGQFGLGYDALSRRTSLTRPNNVTTSYTYDSLSRLLSILHQAGAVTIDGASYTLDNAGNRTSKINQLNGVMENYTYDPLYQLTQVQQVVNGNQSTTENYSYDAVGNRLSSLNVARYSYNNSNELTSSSDGYSYTYDFNGNMLTSSNASGTTQYTWNYDNRLTSVALPDASGVVNFKYDPRGRRIQKSSSNATTNYLYDGLNLLEEIDGNGSIIARYTQMTSVDEPLAVQRSSATSFYSQDGVGSVTSLTDANGVVNTTYTYNSSGDLSAHSGTVTNPLRYTAREYDEETGKYYYRARYYDQGSGRFANEDPIGLYRHSNNFYSYAANNPILLSDPLGLKENCTLISSRPLFSIDQIKDGHKGPWVLGEPGGGTEPEEDDVGPAGPGTEEPGLMPLATPNCVWSRRVAKETWRHTLLLNTYDCVEAQPCGLTLHWRRRRLEWKETFVEQTTTVEKTIISIPSWAVSEAGEGWYEYECLFYRPRD